MRHEGDLADSLHGQVVVRFLCEERILHLLSLPCDAVFLLLDCPRVEHTSAMRASVLRSLIPRSPLATMGTFFLAAHPV